MMTVIGGVIVLSGLTLVASSGATVKTRRKSSGGSVAKLGGGQNSGLLELK
jgi:hypothetical protein